jgi:D-alanine-D-alanine ligase
MGGVSGEREVSLRSGAAVAKALAHLGHEVKAINVVDELLEGVTSQAFDVVFVALHGRFGEDGQVQRILEARGLPYTGSGSEASALAMDKWAARLAMARAGVKVADGILIRVSDEAALVGRQVAPLGWPIVVKPRHGGSSLGVSLVRTPAELPVALAAVMRHEPEAVVERYIPGREFTMGIVGDRVLPPLELVTRRAFYDYEAKYSDEGTEYRLAPSLPSGVGLRLEEATLKVFRALGCRGMGRVDFRLPEHGEPVVLEMNTIPGFTDRSDLPMAAQAAGIPFDQLCQQILEDALAVSAVKS